MVIGVVTGPIFDRGYLRTLLLVGSFLTVFGLMMTSIATSYYQVLLAQGFCVGLGSGCLFVPSLAVVATYFTTKRAFATGISVAGSSVGMCMRCCLCLRRSELISASFVGGVILPITFRKLLPAIGFGWATRVLGFISLALLVVAILVLRTRVTPQQSRSLLRLSAFKSSPYTLHSLGIFVGFSGLYFPLFYVQSYALAQTPIQGDYAFYLLAIMNGSSALGRIVPNFLADKLGPLNMLTPCTVAAGILCLGWIDITDTAGITAFSVFYGFFSGAFVSLLPPTIANLTPDLTMVGTWMGMSLFIGAFGLLIGNPIAGALLDVGHGRFGSAQGFAGGMILGAAFLFGIARMLRSRHVETWKV